MSRENNTGMRTTIRMNEELARRAKRYAMQAGRTFTEVVEEAVIRLLAEKSATSSRRKKVVLPVAGNPRNRMTPEQYKELIDKMDREDDLRNLWGTKRAAS